MIAKLAIGAGVIGWAVGGWYLAFQGIRHDSWHRDGDRDAARAAIPFALLGPIGGIVVACLSDWRGRP